MTLLAETKAKMLPHLEVGAAALEEAMVLLQTVLAEVRGTEGPVTAT